MIRHFKSLVVSGAVALLGVAVPAVAQDAAPKPAETAPALSPTKQVYCPVTPTEEIDPEVFTEYNGQRVYFCCGRCRVKFTKDPETYAVTLASAPAGDKPESTAKQTENPHEHSGDDPPSGQDLGRARDADHEHSDHEHAEHEHGHGPAWLKWLGGFHPPMVNFPIGVLFAAALAELLFIWRHRPEFDHTARFCVAFAALTGIAAGVLGWFFGGIRLTDADPLLAIHRWMGTGTVLWLAALLIVSERMRRNPMSAASPVAAPAPGLAGRAGRSRLWYRLLLFGGVLLVLSTGFFGGAMVYGMDHYLPPHSHAGEASEEHHGG